MLTRSLAHTQAGHVVSCVGSVRDIILHFPGAERIPFGFNRTSSIPVLSGGDSDHQSLQEEGRIEEDERFMLRTAPRARFQVLSLVGTLSLDGLDLHASFGDEQGVVCGGHLMSAVVDTTAEVFIGNAVNLSFSREIDPATGFKQLVVSNKKEPSLVIYFAFVIFGTMVSVTVTYLVG